MWRSTLTSMGATVTTVVIRNPTTGQRVGRRSLHVMSLGDWSFNRLGGTIDFDRAREASYALLSAIRRTARDDTPDESAKTTD